MTAAPVRFSEGQLFRVITGERGIDTRPDASPQRCPKLRPGEVSCDGEWHEVGERKRRPAAVRCACIGPSACAWRKLWPCVATAAPGMRWRFPWRMHWSSRSICRARWPGWPTFRPR